jgi:hypothetical protein
VFVGAYIFFFSSGYGAFSVLNMCGVLVVAARLRSNATLAGIQIAHVVV